MTTRVIARSVGLGPVGPANEWLFGTSAPSASTGRVGQPYQRLDPDAAADWHGDIYLKTDATTWAYVGNNRGLPGEQGAQGLPGVASAAWTPTTPVTTGTVRQAPDGSWISSLSSRTTRATFDATEQAAWTPVLVKPGSMEAAALQATIDDLAGADAQSDGISNPEDPRNSAVVGVVQGQLGLGAANMRLRVDARGNLGAARPTGWLGFVEWLIDAGDGLPVHLIDGDEVTEVEETPIPFYPTDLTSLLAFWDPAVGGFAENASVTALDNLATGAVDFAQASSSAPTYKGSSLAGGPGLLFAGATTRLISAGAADVGTTCTMFVVIQRSSALSSGSEYFIDGRNAGGTAGRLGLFLSSTKFGVIRGSSFTSTEAVDTSAHLAKVIFNATAGSLKLGTNTATTGTISSGTWRDLVLGGKGDGTGGLNGLVGAGLVMTGTPTTDEETDIRAWFASRHPSLVV